MGTNLEITIKYKNKDTQVIKANKHDNLLHALIKNKVYINSPCGGNGTCGKCAVIIMDVALSPNKQEQKLFSISQLSEGYSYNFV